MRNTAVILKAEKTAFLTAGLTISLLEATGFFLPVYFLVCINRHLNMTFLHLQWDFIPEY